jgi:uncharacterized protein (DUF1499 family)
MTGTPGAAPRSLAPCPASPNCVSSEASDPRHAVPPFVLRVSAADAWPALGEAVAAMPRTRIVSSRDGALHAEATSRIFRFVDDLDLVLAPDGRRVDVRSASRVGWSDLGVNRRRVEELRATLRARGLVE